MAWSRLIRFIAREDGKEYYGEPKQSGDVGLLYASRSEITARVVQHPFEPSAEATSSSSSPAGKVLTVGRLLSPLAPRDVPAIRGLGLQYAPAPKQQASAPPVLCLFYKPASSLSGPGDVIPLPELAKDEKNDYEVELCAVIGKTAKDVRPEEAMSYVAGYCVVNDVSSRGLCAKGGQWGMGKTFDGWCPIGPCIVSPAALGKDPHDLKITTHVNGKLAQETSTAHLLARIPEIIARLSHGATLEPGSLILTGSPIAVGRKTPADVSSESPFMQDGDEIRCYVEGCGTLINHVKAVGGQSRYKAKL
ncbi:hypothetical protein JCM10908_002913 [Rhodotorula pacifica]|uniref:fumarylacetoacetate hydrolase family protein n=1 Tax=Rhodotorula pacifica TaxID=1495444 RepID=UPI00317533D2